MIMQAKLISKASASMIMDGIDDMLMQSHVPDGITVSDDTTTSVAPARHGFVLQIDPLAGSIYQ